MARLQRTNTIGLVNNKYNHLDMAEATKSNRGRNIIIGILIIGLIGWLFTPNIDDDKAILKRLHGTWVVKQKSGSYFDNVKIQINDDNTYVAWKFLGQREGDENWGESVCKGSVSLGPVQTYKNVNQEFRRINWSDCAFDLHDAFYDGTQGLYWGEWGPFEAQGNFWEGIQWLFIFIAAVVLIVFRKKIIPFVKNSKYVVYIFAAIGTVLIFYPITANSILNLIVSIIIFSGVPILLFRLAGLKKSSWIVIAMPVYFIIQYLAINQYQSGKYIFSDSFNDSEEYFKIVFYTTLCIMIVLELVERSMPVIFPKKLLLIRYICNPIIAVASIAVPVVLFFFYYSSTRHYISNEEVSQFEKANSDLTGQWFLTVKDSINNRLFKLDVSSIRVGQKYNDGHLTAKIEYALYKENDQVMSRNTIDTIVMYNTHLEPPLQLNNIGILSLKNGTMDIRIVLDNGSFIYLMGTKDKTLADKIVAQRNGLLNQKNPIASDTAYLNVDAIYEKTEKVENGDEVEMNYVFDKGNGEKIVFDGYDDKNTNIAEILLCAKCKSGNLTNKQYAGKSFNIIYTIKNVEGEGGIREFKIIERIESNEK